MTTGLEGSFCEVVIADFEFSQPDGERPAPVCVVAHELFSGRRHRLMLTEDPPQQPPYPIGDDTLFVAYYASAELGCHLALGWPLPAWVLDLCAEFRNLTNGFELPGGQSLLGALVHFGLDAMDAAEKEAMRQLAMRGGPYTGEEMRALLDYCESDVVALHRLLMAVLPRIDLPRAVLRGRYMKAAARIERAGVPLDTASLATLRGNWELIQDRLIRRVDADYGVFEGRTFKTERFAAYVERNGVAWPRLESGWPALDEKTFRSMADRHPRFEPLRQLRVTLSQMRLSDLAVGSDGRNRCLLSAFAAKTGRNQPSNKKHIFGPAVWMRGLIQPPPGYGLAYIDWSQQEFGIAAALSEDRAMIEAYSSGEPYLAFAKQAGAAPPDATPETHKAVRDQFKQCTLAVQYGMGAESFAERIGQPVCQAAELLRLHRATYPKYWRWSEQVTDHAQLRRAVATVFGWTLHMGPAVKLRTISNFPCQANGAEMLRLACCFATERGITVCTPVHDALLIEAPADGLKDAVEAAQQAMAEASALVLDGFALRSEARPVVHPNRYVEGRGKQMWETVWGVITELEMEEKAVRM